MYCTYWRHWAIWFDGVRIYPASLTSTLDIGSPCFCVRFHFLHIPWASRRCSVPFVRGREMDVASRLHQLVDNEPLCGIYSKAPSYAFTKTSSSASKSEKEKVRSRHKPTDHRCRHLHNHHPKSWIRSMPHSREAHITVHVPSNPNRCHLRDVKVQV